MSHYEERLQSDLTHLRQRLEQVAKAVLGAQQNSVRALLESDRSLANATILGDLHINRETRAIDAECRAFVARHLPSAGHLRFISAALRLTMELERIGDYAVTICRESVQLTTFPPARLARDMELLADQSQRALEQAIRSFSERSADLARGTMGMVAQTRGTFDKVIRGLVKEGEQSSAPLSDLLAFQVILNRLGRVGDQAKNICEETLFAVEGTVKGPKVYRVLFVGPRDDGFSQLAAAYARKAFPESGEFLSAGLEPAQDLDPQCRRFMDNRGLDTAGLTPAPLPGRADELARFHVLVSLAGALRPHLVELPYHTVLLEWEAAPVLTDLAPEHAEALLSEGFENLSVRIRQLMVTLCGEGAG